MILPRIAALEPSIARCLRGRRDLLPSCRSFTATTVVASNTRLPPRPKVNEEDVTENFIKGGGAGGQKINKTNSQVQLIHHPTGIQVKCQETRSRSQNRTIARRILAERIEDLEKGDESRSSLKAQKAIKKKANAMKKRRRKYKKLDGEDTGNAAGSEADESPQLDVDDGGEEPTTGPKD